MKRLLLLFIIGIVGCSEDEPDYSYTFKNPTEYTVIVTPAEITLGDFPMFELLVSPGETKTHFSDHLYVLFDLASPEAEQNFRYRFISNSVREIYSFRNQLLYKITGTATSADITYNSSSGNTRQTTINIPGNIAYDTFGDDFYYISAQNTGQGGTVTVEIYWEDKLKYSDTCSGSYCIATASGG